MLTIDRRLDTAASQFIKNHVSALPVLRAGDLASGTLIKKGPKVAYFDLGPFGTGVVFGVEYLNADTIIKNLNAGDTVSAKVVDPENEEGCVELSLAEAGKQKAWQAIKDLKDRGEVITVKIGGANWGGLVAEVEGFKAFIPVSQLVAGHYPRVDDGNRDKIADELRKLVGQELRVKIIDFKPRAGKLILSEKEGNEENMKELLSRYGVGQVVEGIVSGVADFGAFVKFTDNPAIEGLVHISELDHRLIENPKEIVKVNDVVQAKIIEIKEGRVSLSLKALKPDPWATASDRYHAGDEVQGVVARFNPFGAFIALDPDIQGLIHVSEFGSVDEMKRQLELRGTYAFRIELMKPEEKRIILKMKK